MSWQASGWAAKQKTGGPSGKSVLLVLANYADPYGVSWPSQKLMAEQTEQSVDTVQRRLRNLDALGLIKMESRAYRPRGGTVGHIYYLQMPKRDIEPTPQDAVLNENTAPQFAVSETAIEAESTPQLCGTEDSTREHLKQSLTPEREVPRGRKDLGPQLSEFLVAWPTASTDSHSKISANWGRLTLQDRELAIAGIKPFLAELKKNGRERVISGWKYLSERRWSLVRAAANNTHGFDTWSRDWWAVLLAKIDRGERAAAWLAYADVGGMPAKRFCAVKAADMPKLNQLSMLTQYPSDGEAVAAWRPWFEQHGARLPRWSNQFWVFLPSPTPPAGKRSVWRHDEPTAAHAN